MRYPIAHCPHTVSRPFSSALFRSALFELEWLDVFLHSAYSAKSMHWRCSTVRCSVGIPRSPATYAAPPPKSPSSRNLFALFTMSKPYPISKRRRQPYLSPASSFFSSPHSFAKANLPLKTCHWYGSPTCFTRISNAAPYASAAPLALPVRIDAPFLKSASASCSPFAIACTCAARSFAVMSHGMLSSCAKNRRGSPLRNVIEGKRRDSTRSPATFLFAALTASVGLSMSSYTAKSKSRLTARRKSELSKTCLT